MKTLKLNPFKKIQMIHKTYNMKIKFQLFKPLARVII